MTSSRYRRIRTSLCGKVRSAQNLRTRLTAHHEMLYRVGDEPRFDRLTKILLARLHTLKCSSSRKKICDLATSLQFPKQKEPNERDTAVGV